MVISPTLKYAFVSTVKGGTNSLYQVLVSRYEGHRYGDFHHCDVSEIPDDWYLFSTCRNPYTRAVSIWYSTCMRGKDRYQFREMCPNPDSFEQFAEWAALIQSQLWRMNDAQQQLLMPQTQRHGNTRFNRILRMETLAQDFVHLPFVAESHVQLPLLNPTQGQRDRASQYLTDRAINAVQQWMGIDFDRYGYSRSPEALQPQEFAA